MSSPLKFNALLTIEVAVSVSEDDEVAKINNISRIKCMSNCQPTCFGCAVDSPKQMRGTMSSGQREAIWLHRLRQSQHKQQPPRLGSLKKIKGTHDSWYVEMR